MLKSRKLDTPLALLVGYFVVVDNQLTQINQ